mmetsp:Transcript_44051/g.58450  ORF Transcript_44051/g.58450 Transcript_44051/m.58450 type:complete len:98 (+) Transcript_44051:254-547(+)|eukprot:CAMPEP_0185584764 /NCGR_PEP_ID=MMETSP0434-20130131/34156_1 /TAXON_ID=626734 ORGANISM="Favella taraikaensis, Strain Fe Narragansett Bay" /NCGR_SAMPLE_ID=MMETSP0434 /ASSEMBLY_ACC=CAM_ASM_000379 /LENGTH=97 /DNA_ID=CAMNT_0028204715 /DNA_START=244 /DNA_END=537 /DNA_ORIENTATION=-
MGIAKAVTTQDKLRLEQLAAAEQANAQAILDMKSKESGMLRKVAKEQWIKTSFWMPENAEEELKKENGPDGAAAEAEKEEKPRMVCPYNRPKGSDGA